MGGGGGLKGSVVGLGRIVSIGLESRGLRVDGNGD